MAQRLLELIGMTAFISGFSMPLPPRWQGSVISSASVDSRGEPTCPRCREALIAPVSLPFMRSALFRYEANFSRRSERLSVSDPVRLALVRGEGSA